VLLVNLFLGFSSAVIDAGFNAAVASLPGSARLLNYLHAFFGLGALLGPLVASTFLAIHWEWNTVYLTWCVLSLPMLIGSALLLPSRSLDTSAQQTEQHVSGNVVIAALKFSVVWLGALFLFLYVGAEVGVGNWSYSFLLEDRHQQTLLAGWVVSGYWFGLTLGRLLVSTVAGWLRLGIAQMIYACLVGTGIGAVLVWLLPGIESAALGFCLIGFFLGPIFPTTIALMPLLVPNRLVASAIGLLVGASVVGGAFFPWLVGGLAQYKGIWVLLPCTLVLTIALFLNWWAMVHRFAASRP
jgi:fucose permease